MGILLSHKMCDKEMIKIKKEKKIKRKNKDTTFFSIIQIFLAKVTNILPMRMLISFIWILNLFALY